MSLSITRPRQLTGRVADALSVLGARDWHAARLEGARWAPESVVV